MLKAVEAARDLIQKHKLEVPVDIDKLINDLGIDLRIEPMDSMSGFAYRKNGQKVIGINVDDGEKRKRFTKAHELGHMHLHADVDVLFDKKQDFVYFRDESSSTGLKLREIEANAFAAELLMPADRLIERITEIGGIDLAQDEELVGQLADEFNVSLTAMSVRIDSLYQLS